MAEPKNVSELAKWAHDHPAMISEVEKAARRRVSEKGEDTGAEEDDDEEAPDAHLRILTMDDHYSAMEELSGLILSLIMFLTLVAARGHLAQQSMNQTAETLNDWCGMVSGSGAQTPYPPTAAADDPTPVR
ncbi:hypothetical protein FRB98_002059 [Tulasnella sp. 332]|nr:hypothetical protein FRB98_002059 [Tulasnella sp. 332]